MRLHIRVDSAVSYPLLAGWLHHTWPEPRRIHTISETPTSIVGVILDHARKLEALNPSLASVTES
jgi:hypothetical protein